MAREGRRSRLSSLCPRDRRRLNGGAVLKSAAACALLLVPASWSAGATQQWVPTTAGPFTYNSTANWNAGAGPVPGAADIANTQVDLLANQTVNVSVATSLHQLLIGDTTQTGGVYQNHVFGGAQLTFMGPTGTAGLGTIVSQNGDNVINNPLLATTTQGTGLTIDVASGSLSLASANGTVQYTFTGPGTKTVTGTSDGFRWNVAQGTLRAGGTNTFTSRNLTVSAGAIADLNNLNQSIGNLAGTGTVNLGSATLTLRSVQAGQSFTIIGTGGVTLTGGSGFNTDFTGVTALYSGPTTVAGNTLQIDAASDLGDGSATNKLIFASNPAGSSGLWVRAAVTIPHAIELHNDVSALSGDNVTFSGDITGTRGLMITSNSIRLTGTNTYAGDTVISGGNDSSTRPGVIAADSALGVASGGIVLNDDGMFGSDGPFTTSRNFTNNDSGFYGGLKPVGGVMTFQGTGNTSLTGDLWVRDGAVAFNRTGGTTAITPGAEIWLMNGALHLGGTVDALSDGVDHVGIILNNGATPGVVNVAAGTKNAGRIEGIGTVTVDSAATLIATSYRGLDGVQVVVNGTGKAEIRRFAIATNNGSSRIGNLTIAAGARFDIQNNALVWDYTGTSAKAQARQYLINGRGGAAGTPTWTSPGGITSSYAALAGYPHLEAIGYLDNSDAAGGPLSTWRGLTGLDASSILIAYTIPGDANLDFIVNNPDLTIVGANYLQSNVGDWYKGDFNYDGVVNDLDAQILGSGWNTQTTPPTHGSLTTQYGQNFANAFYNGLANPVPEPAAVTMFVLTPAALLMRTRRRRSSR